PPHPYPKTHDFVLGRGPPARAEALRMIGNWASLRDWARARGVLSANACSRQLSRQPYNGLAFR
ncbi:MAG: hypothetical protein WBQ03_21165, partial [Candidatus Sulfotelmatobacter sp.]